MKHVSKTLLSSALFAAGLLSVNNVYATPQVSLGGELAVELTDAEADSDLDLSVTTTDFVITVKETFGNVEVEGYQAFEKGDALARDGAGITVSGAFGSVFVGDDGVGVFAADMTDVMYNNSEVFYTDDATNVIDYGLPLGDAFSLNIFAAFDDYDVAEVEAVADDPGTPEVVETAPAIPAVLDDTDVDLVGIYGSYSVSGLTFALGYTSSEQDATGYDSILDFAVGYEGGPIAAGFGFQDVDGVDDEIMSAFVTYTAGAFAITGYMEDAGDAGDLTAVNVSYSFTDNFYTFLETATGEEGSGEDATDLDNTSIGLVLTF